MTAELQAPLGLASLIVNEEAYLVKNGKINIPIEHIDIALSHGCFFDESGEHEIKPELIEDKPKKSKRND